jgi:hypothetical protein
LRRVDRLRNWGRNPWLVAGTIVGGLLICAWIGWAIRVWSEHGVREALGALIAWAAIAAVIAVVSIPFVWGFRVIRASAGSGEADGVATSPPAEATATEAGEDAESGPEPEAAAN